MRGRPGCPTGQKKTSAGATGGSPLFLLLQGKVGYRIAPSSDPASPAHLPPKGKALGREEPSVADFRPSQGPEQNPICFLHGHAPGKKLFSPRECQLCWRGSGASPNFGSPAQRVPKFLPPPARPAGGRAVTGVGSWAAGQAKKKESPRRAPQPEKVGPGRTNLFLPGVLSSGFLPKKAGPPPGAGRETTSQVLTCAGPNRTTYRRQRTPAGVGGAPWAPAQPPFPPCGERLSFPRAFWYNRGHQPNLSR